MRDSALTSAHFDIHGGFGTSLADLALRFGHGGSFGAGLHSKQRGGFYWGLQADWGFGWGVRELDLLSNLMTPDGELIDNEGQVAFVGISGQMGRFTAELGHLFSLEGQGTNPNSGLLVKFGLGSFHHRIHFENTENHITQLEEPYLSGYDRLTWGACGSAFLGYFHMSDDGRINYFVGLETTQARTFPQRELNYDTQLPDVGPRYDATLGLTAGWVFHLFKRSSQEFWY